MRLVVLFGPAALLAACSQPQPATSSADLNSAAAHAQQDIANYAAATPSPTPGARPSLAAMPSLRGAPPTAAPPPAASPSATPSAASGGVAEARALAERYFGLIDAKRYRQAWNLWRDGGKGSGQTVAAFAAGFAPYTSYKASVGQPFDEDAGAGQRYITVPVTVAATRRRGGEQKLAGTLVLHRVADGIDTPDPGDHQWRIERSTIPPALGKTAG